ncbi:MAG TPA: hypothetical protein VGI70_08940 [Polyangiales bacterium]
MRSLSALLWSCALLGACTGGVATPIYAVELGGQFAEAGHGGDTGGHPAAGSGDGGVHDAGHDPTKSACEASAPPWTAANVDDETAFLVQLNEAIEVGECGDHPFTRDQFTTRGDLTCYSRYTAFSEASGMGWGRPPGQGPSRDPFQPQGSLETEQIVVMGTTSSSALMQVLADGGDCSKLMMVKYTAVGVGHYGDVWVITLGSD